MRIRTFAIPFLGTLLILFTFGHNLMGSAPHSGSAASGQESAASPAASPAGSPVIVELFTSEGCSSCPPADQLLARLQRTQPVAGADIIALEEHVDYWDNLGWKDPFSSALLTERQSDYAFFFHTSGPYTPQMVVDGKEQFLGSNENDALAAIAKEARAQKIPVELEQIPDSKAGGSGSANVRFRIQLGPAENWHRGEAARVILAITEDDLSSNVTRGENAGSQMFHLAVVRDFKTLGRLDSTGAFQAEPKVNLAKDWKRENLRAVAFVQDGSSHDVLGAAVLRLSFAPGKS